MVDSGSDPAAVARRHDLCWSCKMPRTDRHHDADYRMHRSPYDIPGHVFVAPPAAPVDWPTAGGAK